MSEADEGESLSDRDAELPGRGAPIDTGFAVAFREAGGDGDLRFASGCADTSFSLDGRARAGAWLVMAIAGEFGAVGLSDAEAKESGDDFSLGPVATSSVCGGGPFASGSSI